MREQNLPRLIDYSTNTSDAYFLEYRAINSALLRVAEQVQGVLLDIGCGNKPYQRLFSCVTRYIGCDMVQSSQNKVDVITVATELPFSSESFDSVLCTQVIEHVEDPEALYFEACRVLKPGGHLILSGPMYWHLHEEPYDFFRFTKYGLRYLSEKTGFEVIEIIPNGGKWAVLGQVLIHTIQNTWLDRKPLVSVTNRIFAWLDDRYYNDFNTLNYVVIARRKRLAAPASVNHES